MWLSNFNILQQACFVVGAVSGLIVIIGTVMLALNKVRQDRFIDVKTATVFVFITAWAVFLLNFVLPWWWAVLISFGLGACVALGVAILIKRLIKPDENKDDSGLIEHSAGPFANKEEKEK